MKQRPILFSGSMVRALLAGTKTQTRRVLRPQLPADAEPAEMGATNEHGHQVSGHSGMWWDDAAGNPEQAIRCPYGMPGDRLWVKETTLKVEDAGWVGPVYVASDLGQQALEWGYGESDDPDYIEPFALKKRSSLFMSRAMSRITLEITNVHVERLQDISEADAMAEGIVRQRDGGYGLADATHYHSADPRISYWSLWDAINGPGSVEANPWVWAVTFKRVKP
jgi:hypothetical protein